MGAQLIWGTGGHLLLRVRSTHLAGSQLPVGHLAATQEVAQTIPDDRSQVPPMATLHEEMQIPSALQIQRTST